MVDEITKGIYRIKVRLAGSPLGNLNSYYIRGIDEDYLVDTGFNMPQCYEDLSEGLKEIGADPKRISILNTHMHADHTGQNDKFLGKEKHIYLNENDIWWQDQWTKSIKRVRAERDLLEGAAEEYVDMMSSESPSAKYKSANMMSRIIPYHNGDIFEARDHKIEVIEVPGHTVGNSMFWIEKEGIMLTGDHILFDITPNITAWPGKDDMLGWYLDSLERCRKYPVEQACPGHREPGEYHKRIDTIIEHHKERLNEVLNIIGNSEKPLNAYEITYLMKWRIHMNPDGSFPPVQLWFASGECLSHIDRLLAEDKIVRIDPQGNEKYRTYKLR